MVEEAFDVAAVPPYPVVRLVIRSAETEGLLEGLVDGEKVVEDSDLERVREAIIKLASRKAVERPGMRAAIRAVGEDPDGDTFDLVLTGDGEVFERPAMDKRDRGSRRNFIAGAVLLTGLLGAGIGTGAAIVASGGHDHAASAPVTSTPAAPHPVATQVPVPGAPGWAEQATWSVPVGDKNTSSSTAHVATDGQSVFAPADGASPAVAAYDAHTGQRKWRAGIDQQLAAGPFLTQIEGTTAVVAASSSHLYAWTPSGGVIGDWKLNSSQKVTATPTGPVVTALDTQHAQIIVGKQLVDRVLPAAANAVAPMQGGALIAAGGSGQVWSVADRNVAGAATNLQAPDKSSFKAVVASSPKLIVASFTPSGSNNNGKVVLRAFQVGSWKPLWQTGTVPDSSDAAMVAPNGSWATFGTTVIDLDSGKTNGLPDQWRTTSVNDDVGFGLNGDQVRAVTKQSMGANPPSGSSNGSSAGGQQQGPQAAAGGTAFLIASDGNRTHLYAVPLSSPASTSPTSSSSSSSKKSDKSKKSSKSSSSKPSKGK